MVRGEDDDRVVAQAQSVEFGQQATDLLVHEFDGSVVGGDGFALLRFAHAIAHVVAHRGRGRRHVVEIARRHVGQRDLFRRVVGVQPLRGDQRDVRSHEADREEERVVGSQQPAVVAAATAGTRLQDRNGLSGREDVGLRRFLAVGHDDARETGAGLGPLRRE